jgi:hypothetical protein
VISISLILLVLPILAGLVFVSLLWPDRRWQSNLALKASLAVGIGCGIISCVFFIWLLLSGNAHYSAYFAAECALLVISAAVLIARARKRDDRPLWRPNAAPSPAPGTRLLILAALLLLMFSRLAAGLIEAVGQPSGDADAWSTWNLQARFLSRGGPNWVDLARYSYPHHTDYPLMLPLSVARGWHAAGVETAAVPIAIGILFTFGTVLLLFSALSFLRNQVRGFLAGAILMGTPFFILHGARQLADVPLGFFILAATVLFCLQDRLTGRSFALMALAGAACGLAGWTKNEGLLFLGCMILARWLTVALKRGWRPWLSEMPWFLAGLLPVLAIVICFKAGFAPPNDLHLGQNLAGLATPSRYWYIAKEFAWQALTFGHWQEFGPVPFSPVPLLAGYWLCRGISLRREETEGVTTSFLALILTLAGYFCVYLLTPLDLATHIRTSCDRLFLQLWPSLIFICFMAFPSPIAQAQPLRSD